MYEVETILIGFVLISGAYAILGFLITRRYINGAIEDVGQAFSGIFENPTVKKAYSILGTKSGEAKADRAIVDELATDMLDSPQLSGIKMGADLIGVDLDSYIDKHGALGTIQGLTQIAGLLGIDVNSLLAGGASGDLSKPSGNPYLNGGR